MLRLPRFEYLQPKSLLEAASMLSGQGPDVRLVAGGTDLLPNLKRRHQKANSVVSLLGIPELSEIRPGSRGSGDLTLGATALLHDVASHPEVAARYPALARAVASISSPPLRHMATIGGNVCVDTRCTYYNQTEEWRRSISYCMKAEGEICWVAPSSPRCWAHSASDSAPMLQALGARVHLQSEREEREIDLADLFRDDGIAYLGKRPDEILTAIHLPEEAAASRCRQAFWKLRRRGSIDFAVLSAAVALWTTPDGTVERARIVLGSVASSPVSAEAAAEALVGQPLNPETIAQAAKLARKVATPMDNTDFQAQWRGAMVQKYTEAALCEAAGLPVERLAPKHG
jgi:4-hydroxybenzoyl-CoA reductase subunit beta